MVKEPERGVNGAVGKANPKQLKGGLRADGEGRTPRGLISGVYPAYAFRADLKGRARQCHLGPPGGGVPTGKLLGRTSPGPSFGITWTDRLT